MTPPGRDHHGFWEYSNAGGMVNPWPPWSRMVNGLPPDRHGTEIPVKESREMRYFLRMTSIPFAAIGAAGLGFLIYSMVTGQ
jgi:hypothetical protein